MGIVFLSGLSLCNGALIMLCGVCWQSCPPQLPQDHGRSIMWYFLTTLVVVIVVLYYGHNLILSAAKKAERTIDGLEETIENATAMANQLTARQLSRQLEKNKKELEGQNKPFKTYSEQLRAEYPELFKRGERK